MFGCGEFPEKFAKPWSEALLSLRSGGDVISQWVALKFVARRKKIVSDKEPRYL